MQALMQLHRTKWYWGLLLLNALLFLVWPLAHTIALRKLLLLIAAISGVALIWRNPQRNVLLQQPWLKWMAALLAWVIFHAAFLSQNGNEAWRELLGQWLPPYLAIFAGIGVALASRSVEKKWFMRLLLICAIALPVYYLLENLVKWWQVGYLPVGYMKPGEPNFVLAGTDLKTSLTFSLEMLVPFACVRLLEQWKLKGAVTFRTGWWWVIALAMVVAYVSEIKNFMIMLGMNLTLLLLWHGFRKGYMNFRRLLAGSTGVLLLIALVIYQVPDINRLWQSVKSDTQIAWDIDQYQNWKNDGKYGLPVNAMGVEENQSFYLRLAFAHAAWRDMWENPLGYGVTRKAMEKIEQKKNPEVSLSNAHNSYLNMACAVGLPGLGLFIVAMGTVFLQLRESGSKWALPALWMTGFYLLHWSVDAIERDHFFEMFMFMVAILTTLVLQDNAEYERV